MTTDDCARLVATLRGKGLAPKTVSGALVPLGRIFALALRRGYITDHPLRRLEASERPRLHRREQRVLNHAEIAKLLEHCLPSYRPLLATALYSGMRLNELLGLTWGEVDFEAELLHVRYQLSRPHLDAPARRVRLKTKAATRDVPLCRSWLRCSSGTSSPQPSRARVTTSSLRVSGRRSATAT